MPIRLPPPLAKGATIAVTAPSSGVPEALHGRLELALANIEKRGYHIIEGDCLRSQHKNQSAEKEARGAELMGFLTDPRVSAVMPPWGGDLAIEVLELMDFAALARQTPKWFVGFSDLSTLQLPLTLLAGWGTLHGPNLMDLNVAALDPTTAALWHVLETPRGSIISQHPSAAHEAIHEWSNAADAAPCLNAPTQWKRLDGSSAPLQFEGVLIGGCLDIITRLAGTPYAPLPRFSAAQLPHKSIVYFENVEMNPCELTRALYSLRLHGWFKHAAGILIGRSAAPVVADAEQLDYLGALHKALGQLDIPILYDVDIGHLPPQLSLVNGSIARVHFSSEGSRIEQQL